MDMKKMDLKLEGGRSSGIRLHSSSSSDVRKLSSFDSSGREGESITTRRRNRINSKNFMLISLLVFSSNRILCGVEGNSDVEHCVRLMHSGGGGGGGGGLSPNSGASGITTGGGGNNVLSSSNVVNTNSEHAVISCQIRTLSPSLDVENLTSSIIPAVDVSGVGKLRFVCNDVLFFESEVGPGQLSGLSELHELTIEKCKLRHLPADFLSGVRHLRKLTINTGNSEWAARSLELSPGAFSQTPQIRYLHLGFNHIWSLPQGLLCQLHSLNYLNLTFNGLNDIDDLGLPGGLSGRMLALQNEYSLSPRTSSTIIPVADGCLGDLKILDVSNNALRTLGSRSLERMKRLQELRVNNNWLEELEDNAFTGMGQLRHLNLSSNKLVALPAKLFQPCKLLQDLDLRNNSLTALAPGLLSGLDHLQVLDLSMNQLSSQWITAEAFKSLVRLVILDLSHNAINHLAPTTFNDLYSLQVLDLSHNLISSIDDGTFARMSNLHSLNLGNNRLVTVTANVFNGLYVLHKLILDYNQIETIESGALKNCTSLQDLGLVGNRLTKAPESLRDLQLLRTLDLGENQISSLNNESFQGLSQLYGLRLVDNKIEEIPKGLCDSVPRLRVFNIAQNKIRAISSSAFVSCPDLKVLRLDSNKLDVLPTTLAPQLQNLLWLNVSENLIRHADYSLLPPSLEWFDVSYNKLESLRGAWSRNNEGGSSTTSTNSNTRTHRVQNSSRLRVVDASNNQLSHLDYNSVPGSMEVLRLSHNRLNTIAPDTFIHSTHLRRVELIGNQLENIPVSALRLPQIPATKQLPEFLLGGNPLLCGCSMEWLLRINQLSSLRQHPTVLDLDAIICRVSYSRTVTHIPLPDMKPQDFLCPYKSHCFALCHCCDFDACDCEMSCPNGCECYHDQAWSANIVDCSNANYTQVPARLPMDSSEIYLDGNHIPALKSHAFIGRKNLKVLYLNSSGIDTINNKSFNGLQSLQTLHLENNLLKVLHGYEFDHLTRLRELYLQDNMIESISNSTFLHLKNLEILRLDGNKLVSFTVWQLSLNSYLVEIYLARNQWNCDCQFLHQLYGWVTDNSRKVIDLPQLQCVWNITHKPGPHLIDYNRTCSSSWALMGIDAGLDFTISPLFLIFGLVSMVFLLITSAILLIMCRDNVRLFLFSRFGIRMCPGKYDDEKLYDAYLIYSQKDEELVAQRIADELETNDSYKLCLHYREMISETGDLKEMMKEMMENSKSVVVILSRNFLQGEWSSGEYRQSFSAVLKKSQKNSRDMKKVVIVFVDDMSPLDVNQEIRSWVREQRIQVIKWSAASPDPRKQRKFWSKLKYSLPPPSSHYHSNITTNTTTATSASSNESSNGGIMATLKYSVNNPNEQQIIVDELNRTMTMNINNKLWQYGAAPPKYQVPSQTEGGNHQQQQSANLNLASHLSNTLSNYSHQHHHHHGGGGGGGGNPHHYHTPLLLSNNPPKSPPSSKSTDSTTTNNGETEQSAHTPTGFPLVFQHSKSPVPVPKSLYNSNNSALISGSSNSNNSQLGGGGGSATSGGESYLTLEEHVYSSLDPPSPPQHTNSHLRLLNNIHLPNGYTYQPQVTMAPHHNHHPHPPHPHQQQQWHPPPSSSGNSTPKGTLNFGNVKSFKHQKDGSNNPVQTYLV